MNLSENATQDHNHSYQKKGRNKDGSRAEWIDQPTFIKGIITCLKKKWIHGYQNMTVMSNRTKIF